MGSRAGTHNLTGDVDEATVYARERTSPDVPTASGGTDLVAYNATGLAGATDHDPTLDTVGAWQATPYRLQVTPTDRVGHTRILDAAPADVQVPPNVTSLVPARNATTDPQLNLSHHVNFTAYPGLAADEATVRVRNASTGAVVHEDVFDPQDPATLESRWETPEDGLFNVTFEAVDAAVGTRAMHQVNVTDEGRVRNLTSDGSYEGRDEAYPNLNDTNGERDKDLFRLVHPSSDDCSDSFTVEAWDADGHDIDLYLTEGDPEDVGNDTSNYDISEDGSDDYEVHTVTGVSGGTTYSLLVTHENATDTSYAASHYVDCSSAGVAGSAGPGGGPGAGSLAELGVGVLGLAGAAATRRRAS